MSHFQAAQRALSELLLPPEEDDRPVEPDPLPLPAGEPLRHFLLRNPRSRKPHLHLCQRGAPLAALRAKRNGKVERLQLNHLFVGMIEDHAVQFGRRSGSSRTTCSSVTAMA